MQAVKSLNCIIYGDKQVQTKYFLESKFENDDFSDLPAVSLKEMSKEFEGLTNLPIEFQRWTCKIDYIN